ncbi:MAG: 50S ribosomal protein L7ae-like protein [Clostridiaceae bacterium]|nr:50S ribosomal protein L7ae-like protein [Clostridiaceae bacterium]
MLEQIRNSKKSVGLKQSLKAIQNDEVNLCILARDAEERITKRIKELCEKKSIEIAYADDMKKLGKACNIDVGAAVVCILK